MEPKTYIDQFFDICLIYGPKVLSATVLFVGGMWVIRRLTKAFDVFLRARNVDSGLRPFFTSLTDTALKVVLVLVVASTIGIETTSFIAIFSAIAFSVGLALQGSLGNFASGVLILLFKPFKVGDWLTVAGYSGKVVEIQIFSTILRTPTAVKIIIPNGKVMEGPMENIVGGEEVQAEVSLLISSGTSLEKLRQVVDEVVGRCPLAIPGKESEVKTRGLSRDDMNVEIGLWTLGENYEEACFYLYEELKIAFAAAGIELAKERRRETI